MTFLVFLVLAFAVSASHTQTQKPDTDELGFSIPEQHFSDIEELAMCHHAIQAAYHLSVAFHQNPHFRYVVQAPHNGRSNIYPSPIRCKNGETGLVLAYTQMSAARKAQEDKFLQDCDQLTIAKISADAEFLTVVINKMEIEGDKASFIENMDKDIVH